MRLSPGDLVRYYTEEYPFNFRLKPALDPGSVAMCVGTVVAVRQRRPGELAFGTQLVHVLWSDNVVNETDAHFLIKIIIQM